MSSSVPLACGCGKIRGAIEPASPSIGRRVVCMCIDCQTFARWLGNEDAILDEVGGTDIYQTTPSRVRIEHGREHIRCVRLSPKGTYRFYAGCCRTPLANQAVSPGIPFCGIPHRFMDHDGAGVSRDDAIGPVRARVQAKGATGPAPEGSHHEIGKLYLAGAAAGLLWDRLRGGHRPNAFRADDGSPIAEPEILSKEERSGLRAQCGPRRAAVLP
ncbi:MAG: DUF6151 family protein [Nannocystaceae bacterium]|nr:DUF6151 family protein [bacterium]